MFKAFIFDCDGVLIMNTNELYDMALKSAVLTFLPDTNPSEILDVMLKTRGKTFKYQLELIYGKEHPLLPQAILQYEKFIHLQDNYQTITLLKGADKVLQELKIKGFYLCLATGMNPSLLSRLFKDGVLPNVFDKIGLVHNISNPLFHKPHPKLLQDLITEIGISPRETVYIGDTEDDIVMGRKCGIYTIAVLTGRISQESAFKAGADLVLDSVLEVSKWI